MCCKRIYLIAVASFLLFTFVNGSCLEYGHSCWGAHGKRSEGSTAKNLHSPSKWEKMAEEGDRNTGSKANFANLDDFGNERSKSNIFRLTGEDNTKKESKKMSSFRDTPRLTDFLLKYKEKLLNKNSNSDDDSLEQDDKDFEERWQKFPIFKSKPLSRSQSENEVLQQPSQRVAFEDSFYYDLL